MLLAQIDTTGVLRFLGLRREVPSLDYLARIQTAMKTRVPWETASRVVRAHRVQNQQERPRRPAEYWQRAIIDRTGGTCFESDYALWALLRELGFDARLHINDMPSQSLTRCHAAVTVGLDGERYLCDVGLGMRLREPLRLPAEIGGETRITGDNYDQTLRRLSADRFEVMNEGLAGPRQGQLYELVDRVVDVEEYDARVVEDYGEGGLFLDGVTVARAHADGQFDLRRPDGAIRHFDGTEWFDLPPMDTAGLARMFDFPYAVLKEALELTAEVGAR